MEERLGELPDAATEGEDAPMGVRGAVSSRH